MNILGNKPEEDDVDMLVCVAAEGAQRPVYGSLRAECEQCKTPIWVSVSGQKALRERKSLRPFCIKCAHENMEKSEEKPKAEIVEGAIDELRRHFLNINNN